MKRKLKDILSYEQPARYIVASEDYSDEFNTPVLTAGKSFVLGYTNEKDGICEASEDPVIIFDDFTADSKYVDFDFKVKSSAMKILRKRNTKDILKYFFYAMQAIEYTPFSHKRVWISDYSNLTVPNEIVSRLESVEGMISNAERQLALADELVKSRFIEMFGDYSFNPKGWRLCRIGDITTDVRYGTSLPASEDGEYPYLRMNNITYEGELDLSEVKRINVPLKDLDKCSVRKGDVLFNRTNSWDKVGKTCVYDQDGMMVLAGFIIRVRVANCILPEFLSAFLNTSSSKEMFKQICKRAIGQANINAEELKSIGIFLPPINLQGEYVAFKQQVDKSKLVIKKNLAELEELKNSLMQKYFFD